jgi:hypothetical protein
MCQFPSKLNTGKTVQGSDTTMLEKELTPEQKKLFLEAAIFLFLMQVLL